MTDFLRPGKALVQPGNADEPYSSPAPTPARSEVPTDTERLDWLQHRVNGTGWTLMMGGVCYWSLEIQRAGPRSKITRIGEGEDLREAIDDAISRAADEGR